jgi:hypothetical protein
MHSATALQQLQQQLSLASDSSSSSSISSSADGSGIVVDIACLLPAKTADYMQQSGLAALIVQQQQQQQQQQLSCQMSSGSHGASDTKVSTQLGADGTEPQNIPVAIEVDGPSHAAVNDRHHLLGSTICRNWLLQWLGWRVLNVSWWELPAEL